MSASFAHPAASIPFRRYGLNMAALVIGSMTPDFLYFVPWGRFKLFGHTPPGLFLFCIPAGLAALWIFHHILKYPLFSLLPESHQQRVWTVTKPSADDSKRIIIILLSLFVGALTHVVWDSFTHYYGWMVLHVSFLRFPLLETSQGTLRLYKVLQHGGTIGGSIIILRWYFLWLNTAPVVSVPSVFRLSAATKLAIISCGVILPGLTAVTYGHYKVPIITNIYSFSHLVIHTARAGLASLGGIVLVFGICWKLMNSADWCEWN